jgi:hypothetical protein
MSNPNRPIKKIYVNEDVLIDFRLANAAPDDVAEGKTFFGANGTLEPGTG